MFYKGKASHKTRTTGMFQQISWATPAARSSCSSVGEPSLPCLLRGHTLPSRPSSWRYSFSDVLLSCLNLLNPQKTNPVPSPQIQAFLQLLSSMDSVKGPPIAKAAVREGTGPQQLGGGSRGGGDGERRDRITSSGFTTAQMNCTLLFTYRFRVCWITTKLRVMHISSHKFWLT